MTVTKTMSQPLRILGFAGSLREFSYSRVILDAIAEMFPGGTKFDTIAVDAMPPYNEDLEHSAVPASVVDGRAMVRASDAILIVTPEFNHGLPGVLKNTLDWLSRPAFESCFVGKPVLFATISPGALGGVRAQHQLRETLASMLCKLIPVPEIAITYVGSKITDGRLTDVGTRNHIQMVLDRFMRDSQTA